MEENAFVAQICKTSYENDLDFESATKVMTLCDFKNFIEDETFDKDEEDKIISFLNYKYIGGYDCDKIYGEIFKCEYTDTINSFWTIFKKYIKTCLSNEFELENGEIPKEIQKKYKNKYGDELSYQKQWCLYLLELYKSKKIDIHEDIITLAEMTHTIGNFIEVPKYFNANRYNNTFDYWDITLLCIYKWFNTKSDYWLKILLGNNEKAMTNTKLFLEEYQEIADKRDDCSAWEAFIILNDLMCYVDENKKPIELFDNHFKNFEELIKDESNLYNYEKKEKLLNPQTEEYIIQCVINMSNLIYSRGLEISEYEIEKFLNNND